MQKWLLLLAVACGCGGRSVAAVTRTEAPTSAGMIPASTGSPGREGLQPSVPSGRRDCLAQPSPTAVALPPRVTLREFWDALAAQITEVDASALRGRFDSLARRHGLDPETPGLWEDFVKVWVAFEATRDGGWWRVRWAITNQDPSSVRIWKSWIHAPPNQSFDGVTAVAECDEITSLFAVTARQLGVRGIGLYYPTWNHTIAAWAPAQFAKQSQAPVVLVPTTQIFQGCASSVDVTTFAVPKHVYEYPRYDVRDTMELPVALAAFLLEQVRAYAEASPDLLALIRAKRANLLVSSVGDDCDAYRRELAEELRGKLTCADRRALKHLADVELGKPELDVTATLAWLGTP